MDERNKFEPVVFSGEITPEITGVKYLLKKTIRKSINWFVAPFGTKQNEFNQALLELIQENNRKQELKTQEQKADYDLQKRYLQEMSEENSNLKQNIESLKSELNSMNSAMKENLADIWLLHQSMFSYMDARTGRTKLNAGLELFGDNALSNCYIDIKPDYGLKEQLLHIAGLSGKNMLTQAHLNDMTRYFENAVSLKIGERKKRNIIAILCKGAKALEKFEAIRKEAYNLYVLLLQYSNYNIRLISLESDEKEIRSEGGVIWLNEDHLQSCLDHIKPELLIVLEATPIIMKKPEQILKYKTLFRLTGQNPLQKLPPALLEELKHYNDYGLHSYMVESRGACDKMLEAGFHRPVISYPVINKDFYFKDTKTKRMLHEVFTVGFASSPMSQEHLYDRGIELLNELACGNPDITFIILWRDQEVQLPEPMANLLNCRIIYGEYDMKEFYQDIDCLLIPYQTSNYNHACSLSALEAMMNAIPVVSTQVSGISELIEETGLGIVAGTDSQSITNAFHCLKSDYASYSGYGSARLLSAILDSRTLVYQIEQIARCKETEYIPSLKEWDQKLQEGGKYLVKGVDSIKKYYSQQEIAENYNAERFQAYPLNCINELERASIRIILNQRFSAPNAFILDIASGDGRIVQECLRYGTCLAADNSEAMLHIVKERFAGSDNLNLLCLDYFNDVLKGEYDVITTFRYLRHFEYGLRTKLYKKLHKNLKENGILIFDVPNKKLELALRNYHGWNHYNIYDALWNRAGIISELRENGFRVEYMIPVGEGLMNRELGKEYEEEPITWTVGAVKDSRMK